jgi:polyisoprenyl-teichoic acid--peptidoglycan teichoic acid transferase
MASSNLDDNSAQPAPRRGSVWKFVGWTIALVFLCVVGLSVGVALKAFKSKKGEAGPQKSLIGEISDIGTAVMNPKQGFPGKNKVVICCMGIDDNWTNSDVVYTAGARTDTLFLLTLNLDDQTATMLSIPRDAYVPIAGTDYSDKINSAYATGGPKRTEETVANWLGVNPDYYIVLNIDATKRMVDALGGVDVDVEHQMAYDDDWGHLHVHLKPGFQHMNGDNAVAFARYRHGNKGVSPEDGDERRMYRQHVLFKAMIVRAKTFQNITQANNLIDIGMDCIRTDLTRSQLFDIASLYHNTDPDTGVTTASLAGEDGRGAHGAYVMLVDQKIAQQYVDWLVNGNESAGRALTPVRIANATLTPGLAAQASTLVVSDGFTDAHATALPNQKPPAQTEIIDSGVINHAAATEIAATLGLPNAPIIHQAVQPNRFGWTPTPELKVILGSDYVAQGHQQTAAVVQ